MQDFMLMDTSPNGVVQPSQVKQRRKRGPNRPRAQSPVTASQYVPTFFQACILLSLVGAWATQNPEIVMSDREATDIATPAANLFAKSSLAAKYGKVVAEGNDWLSLTSAIMGYTSRVTHLDTRILGAIAQRGKQGISHAQSKRPISTTGNQKSSGFTETTGTSAYTGDGASAGDANPDSSGNAGAIGFASGQLIQFGLRTD